VNTASPPAAPLLAVVTTVATLSDAQRLARMLVEQGLAACAQVSEIESFYPWEGQLQQEREWRVVFKTAAERYAAVEAAIREAHPYELPAIVAVALERAYEPYAHWVAAHSGAAGR
jgi:periplasmic divalent cation tolerance protein